MAANACDEHAGGLSCVRWGRQMLGQHAFLWLLLALALVHGLLYMAVTPVWHIPDEPYHFVTSHLPLLGRDSESKARWELMKRDTAASLLTYPLSGWAKSVSSVKRVEDVERILPHGLEKTVNDRPRSYPYYVMSYWLAPVMEFDATTRLYWARLPSLFALLGMMGLTYASARMLLGDDPFGYVLMPLIVLWQPQHSVIFAGLSDSVPGELTATAAICVWLWGVTRGWRWFKVVGLVVLGLLAVAAKGTNWFLVLAIPVWFLIRYRRSFWRWQTLVPLVLLFAVGVATALSSRYVVNSYLKPAISRILEYIAGSASPTEFPVPLTEVFYGAFRTFWTTMGWNTLRMDVIWSDILLIACVAAVLGFLLSTVRRFVGSPSLSTGVNVHGSVLAILILCILFAGVNVLVFFVATSGINGIQGRYLYGAIVPIAALLALGWRQWLPARWRWQAAAVIASGLFFLDSAALLLYAVPYFYPIWL